MVNLKPKWPLKISFFLSIRHKVKLIKPCLLISLKSKTNSKAYYFKIFFKTVFNPILILLILSHARAFLKFSFMALLLTNF